MYFCLALQTVKETSSFWCAPPTVVSLSGANHGSPASGSTQTNSLSMTHRASIKSPRRVRSQMIGVDNIVFKPHEFLSPSEEQVFREALVRNKQRSGLYGESVGDVSIQGGRLFRTRLELPANVPTGEYTVTVLLVDNREVVSRSTRQLSVRKVGIEAKVTEFAFEQSLWYGILAVLIALIAGWFAGFVFRKV